MEKEEFVRWFSELDKDSVPIAGGKGANLAEIYNLKINVPLGFIITTKAYDYFIKDSNLNKKIEDLLGGINYDDVKDIDEATKKIRDLIIKAKMPEDMKDEIIESYESLGSEDSKNKSASDIIDNDSEEVFVAVRSSATTEDLSTASFAGQQDSFVNIKGKEDLIEAVKKVFASLFTSRAVYYRNKKGFKEDSKLAVVVQRMVESVKSGVIFSKDPSYKNDHIIIEAVFGLGEGIVSGKITPDKYDVSEDLKLLDKKISNKKIAVVRDNESGEKNDVKLSAEKSKSQVLDEKEKKSLAGTALKLEEHYGKPQDIEFAIDETGIYIVQTRAITTIKNRSEENSSGELHGEIMLTGLGASPGIGFGKVRIVKNENDLEKVRDKDVLVTKMTNPNMVVTMQKASAIVTDEGGITSHAAIVSREMGIPCVVGTEEATIKLKENEIVTVDGFTGKVYKGKVSETVQKEVLPVEVKTKTNIKLIVDVPSAAQRAAKTGLKEVGLLRLEGIIAESGKHPNFFLKNKNFSDYENMIFKGVEKIANHFDRLWIRTSDIRSDEFKNLEGSEKEVEGNPMLGMHGIRYGLKHPEILKAELKALKRISQNGKKIGILLPQIISVDEVKKLKGFVKEIDFSVAEIGIMIETPAAVQIIKELCDEKIDFISFGTNDLTQYTLAIDRNNEAVQEIYDERNPAVLKQLEYVLRIAKKNGVETSICGQAGSKKEMVEFLVDRGIDSISVNPDAAKEVSEYVYELEGGSKENLKLGIPKNELVPGREMQEGEETEAEEHNLE